MARETEALTVAPRLGVGVVIKRLRSLGRFMRTKPLGAIGLVILFVVAFIATTADLVAPYDPLQLSRNVLVGPSGENVFGTDRLGRDILSRVIHGSRISIYVGLTSMLAASVVGAIVGTASAYFGGKVDLVVQRFIDATAGFPTLLLALALTAAFGSSLNNIIFALVIVFTPRVARVVRSVSLSIKETPYVESARAIGASDLRIMLRHVLPNTFASLIVVSTSLIGSAVLIEASLSFLGVSGLPASVISWGSMLSGDVLIDFANAPWVGIFPASALTIAVFGVNMLGDALRDVLDPRLRGSQGGGGGT